MKQKQPFLHRVLLVVVALALPCFGLAIPSLARPHHAAVVAADLAADQVVQRFSISGTVTAVDYDANLVTISSGGKHVVISITPTTAIEDRGTIGSMADIHRGRKITASGVTRDGTLVAQSVLLR